MNCVVCGRSIKGEKDVCKECDRLMDMLYRRNPKDKNLALRIFRRESHK